MKWTFWAFLLPNPTGVQGSMQCCLWTLSQEKKKALCFQDVSFSYLQRSMQHCYIFWWLDLFQIGPNDHIMSFLWWLCSVCRHLFVSLKRTQGNKTSNDGGWISAGLRLIQFLQTVVIYIYAACLLVNMLMHVSLKYTHYICKLSKRTSCQTCRVDK